MSKVISISQMSRYSAASLKTVAMQKSRSMNTDDYRRLLSELQLLPPSQRAFLRKFLKRAAASGMPVTFPVTTLAVVTP